MKITFNDKSFIEIVKQPTGKIMVVIQATDHANHKITNAVELTPEQFQQLVEQ